MPAESRFKEPSLQLARLLSESRIAVQCPDRPDPDTLAASYALLRYFSSHGKRPHFHCAADDSQIGPGLRNMLQRLDIPPFQEPSASPFPGLLLLVGCQPGNGSVTPCPAARTAVIDVKTASSALPDLHDIRPHITACSTLVWQLLSDAGFAVDPRLGSVLLYGLYHASNAFTEIRFPLDKDMRDGLTIDRPLFSQLKRSSLSPDDLALTARALHSLDFHVEPPFILLHTLPCEPEVLRFVSDLALRVYGTDLALAFFETARDVRFAVRAGSKEFRASEVVARCLEGSTGFGGGGAEKGGGMIPAAAYRASPDGESPFSLFAETLRRYVEAYDIASLADPDTLPKHPMHSYQKLPHVQACVRCSDLFPKRRKVHVRMLEGDITITAAPDVYLMIGLQGEVYPIKAEVFEKTYTPTDAPFTPAMLYEPTVLDTETGERIPLLAHAHPCVSTERRVLAKPLERGLKLFTPWDDENYMRREPGDWLVQRKENKQDMYIVTAELFPQLYRKVR